MEKMKKGQKVKYQDKYYWIRAVIKRKEADFILIKQGNRHIEVKDTEVKLV
ncbi:hypothetical protein [Ligilactobacillus salivarius]|uniref:hypothetical protein n=1 Tax=Ligilactobacillus salivarius TaxID=1624 RepID=UPI001555E3AB|nr:hypothetical protein [Ligilactobacillus salivarius]